MGELSQTGNERKYGTDYFGISNECETNKNEPKSIHHLKPSDIDVLGALGDSTTAANAAEATSYLGFLISYRGVSFSIGGDGTLEDSITLPNIIRQWRPNVRGASMGAGPNAENGFNAAITGTRSRGMPDQAREIIKRMKEDNHTDFESDWKVITLFIGGNDLCALRRDPEGSTPEAYISGIKEALDILHQEMPRALVNVLEQSRASLLPQVKYGFGSTDACRLLQSIECPFVSNANESESQFIEEQTRLYQQKVRDLIASGRYDTRNDFTVVDQPFLRNSDLPKTSDGQADATYFANDCFHLSSKGHAKGALNLWKSMLQPVGSKSTTMDEDITTIPCPSKDFPYIYTNINSRADWEGNIQPETEEPTSWWIVVVICVLVAALLLQTLLVISLVKANNSKSVMLANYERAERRERF